VGASAGMIKMSKAMTALMGPMGLVVAGIVALGVAFVALNKHMSQDSIQVSERFGKNISDGTQKALGAFMDLEEQTTTTLNQMLWSGETVSTEMKDTLISNFDSMSSQITSKLNETKESSKATLQEMFVSSTT
uniref:hypothetical protein n=1 Tax=Clostridioides difficile TaxID=1496 RepID=UPI002ED50D0E